MFISFSLNVPIYLLCASKHTFSNHAICFSFFPFCWSFFDKNCCPISFLRILSSISEWKGIPWNILTLSKLRREKVYFGSIGLRHQEHLKEREKIVLPFHFAWTQVCSLSCVLLEAASCAAESIIKAWSNHGVKRRSRQISLSNWKNDDDRISHWLDVCINGGQRLDHRDGGASWTMRDVAEACVNEATVTVALSLRGNVFQDKLLLSFLFFSLFFFG